MADEAQASERDEIAEDLGTWLLWLYVAGQTPKSLRAYSNLKHICDEHLPGRYEIEVVDLLENPALAQTDQILALPTVIRRLPPPQHRIIGDLSDAARSVAALGLT